MARAVAAAHEVRRTTAPNPWVGAVVVAGGHVAFEGATAPPGGPHAEVAALEAAGAAARGATLYVTLEPCSHHGRTPPCVDAIVAAGISRVVVGIADPDPHVAGRGLAGLRAAGVAVEVGVGAAEVEQQLAPYLVHRREGRPWVTLKLATTLDGRIAAADGTSTWITGPEARADAHALRADHDAVLVGAGTVRADDPALTVRHVEGADPIRVVLGHVPAGAQVQPAWELQGPIPDVLRTLAAKGVLSVLVEGGATVAGEFHAAGCVDRYVLYVAPALLGDAARPLLAGWSAGTMAAAWRGRIADVRRLGEDLRIDVAPRESGSA
jgi:diaminohydroxyphosphoribosylaminopyrimidine deaminase/5-amino-6-(5-phosphoribosylamino)uracil reductase